MSDDFNSIKTIFANHPSRSGLERIFDDQVSKIHAMIDQELQRLEQRNGSDVQVVSSSLHVCRIL